MQDDTAKAPAFEYVIKAPSRINGIDLKELWRYRDLFAVMSWRDLSIRYKQTALGALWAIFQPFVSMLIFTFIFNVLAHMKSGDGTPYPIFVFVGLLFWQYYSGTLAKASESMISNAAMVQKVYFPRLILPAATAITGLVDLLLGMLILVGMMIYYHFMPQLLGVVLLPVLLVCAFLTSMGVGLFTASLNIKYRDVRQALPFFIQLLMYVTPVVYPVDLLNKFPVLKLAMEWLNPISGVISTARASFLGHSAVDWKVLAISFFMSIVFFTGGLIYFRATERYFADIV